MFSFVVRVTPLVLFCSLSVVLFAQQPPVNSDEGVDLLVNACRYCGRNAELYQSARFTCEFASEAAGYHEEFVKNGFARRNVIISRRPNFNVRLTYDRVLLKQVTTYPKESALRRYYGDPILLHRDGIGPGNDNLLSVEYEPDAGTAIIDRSIMSAPHDFFSFGRIRDDFSGEPVLKVISMLNAVRPKPKNKYHFSQKAIDTLKILIAESNKSLGIRLFDCVGEVKYDDSTAKVVECRKQDGGLMLLLWIDPSKGYVCPFMQTYDDRTGNLRYEHKASQFFKEEKSGLWFPAYYEHTQNSAETDFKTFQARMVYKIDKDSFQFNVKISDEEFAVDIPEGQSVSDRRKGENQEIDIYKAKQQGVLSLSDYAMDLTKKDWLEDISSTVTFIRADGTKTPLKPPKTPPKKDSLSSFIIRIVLTSVGVVMILVAVIVMIIRRFRRPPLPLVLLPLLLFMGCNVQPNVSQGKVTVEPAAIDFGQKRPSDSPVKCEFKLHNNTDKPLTITDVSSGCGCTAMGYPKEPIAPKATVAVPVKVSLPGRFGDFTSKIKVKTDTDETYEVDVKGKIVNDLWMAESSLRCTAESGQAAKGLLEVHTVDYHDVKFDFTGIDKRLTVTEIARNTADGETVIKFDVAVDTKAKDDADVSLILTPLDSKIVPLIVPVYCYSSETPTLAPVLQTKTIALGTVTGTQHDVSVYGDTDLMSVIKQAEFIGSPEGVTVKILTSDNSDALRLSFQFSDTGNQTAEQTIKGNVKLTTAGKREWNIPVSGLLRRNGGQNVSQIQQ